MARFRVNETHECVQICIIRRIARKRLVSIDPVIQTSRVQRRAAQQAGDTHPARTRLFVCPILFAARFATGIRQRDTKFQHLLTDAFLHHLSLRLKSVRILNDMGNISQT